MNKKRITWISVVFLSLLVIALGTIAGTGAWFSDSVDSDGNTINAGTLILNVDGSNTAAGTFTVNNAAPGMQRIPVWTVKNVGSITGYLDIEGITITENGNTLTGPESKAGEAVSVGDLADLISANIILSPNNSPWLEAGDVFIQNNVKFAGLASSYDTNIALAPGETKYIVMQCNWWSNGAADNLGQSDSLVLDFTFELAQTTGQ